MDQRKLEQLKFEYIKAGFNPEWDKDPYRVFVYTTLQERATQISHANTGRVIEEYEPLLGGILSKIAMEEARHFTFYRKVFTEILKRDPSEALRSAAHVLPAIDMPGITIPGLQGFRRRDPPLRNLRSARLSRDRAGPAGALAHRGAGRSRRVGPQAQETLLEVPERLKRIADLMETRSRAKTFAFEVAFAREFVME